MKPLNIFNTPSHDFNTFLDIRGEYVYVNRVATRAVITTSPEFKDDAVRVISTQTPIKRGDIVFYDNRYWLIISQSDVKRQESYKARMQLVEYDIIFNLKQDNSVTPPTNYLVKAPVLISETSDLALAMASSVSMEMIAGEIHIFVQENDLTKRIHGLRGRKGKVIFGQLAWDIIGISTVQKGLLDVTCQVSTISNDDNMVDEVSGATHQEVLDFLDTSMFMDGNTPEEPETPPVDPEPEFTLPNASVVTDVDLRAYSSNSDGALYFTKDTNADTYDGLVGYRVIVTNHLMFGDSEQYNGIINDTSDEPYVVIGTGFGGDFGWTLEIRAIYSDGSTTVEITGKQFDGDTQVETEPQNPPLW